MVIAAVMAAPLFGTVLKDDVFEKNARGWIPLSGSSGKLQRIEQDGTFVLQMTPVERNGAMVGKFYTNNSRQINFFAGDTISLKVTAKGSGKIVCGVLNYVFNSGSPAYNPGGEFELTSEYKTYEFTAKLDAQYRMILPYIEIKGDKDIFVSKFFMETVADENTSIELVTAIQVSSKSSPAKDVEFKTSLKNSDIAIARKNAVKSETVKAKTDSEGNVAVPASFPEGFWEISASANGKAATGYVDVQSEDVYKATDSNAKKIRLSKPLHVLILGDSLSDHYRGYNYVDRMNFWVNKYNPGKFTFRNAGVGGDFCQRMVDRLNGELRGKNWAWRQEMYKDLFKEKYDLIFLFLGQNDTRSFRKSEFKEQTTPPDLQKKCLNEIYRILKENCPDAKVVLIAPSPSYPDIMIKHAEKDPGNPSRVVYGISEFVDAYDAVNKEFCKANGLDYVDILTAMRAMPVRKDLYVTDGIHLSPLGGRVIADELIKFLAEKYK